MNNDGYYREKLSSAVECLVGTLDIRTRVLHALISMTTVGPDGFSDKEMGDRFLAIYERATANPEEVSGEGKFNATLRQLSDDDVAEIAGDILELHNAMLRAAPKDEY